MAPQLSDPVILPCGLELPNRLSKAAMAEGQADKRKLPAEQIDKVYDHWADGGWGMVLTGNVQVSEKFPGGPTDVTISGESGSSEGLAMWKKWAADSQRNGTPAIVQINHPGRQSPAGTGTAGFREKRVAPSAVKLNLGNNPVARLASSLIFGTPRPLTVEEIRGPGGIVEQFVGAAVQSEKAGFKGVELHAAHGYLLAQFMSPTTNMRTDEFGGSAANRARIVVEVVHAIRAKVGKGFAVGIKLNSVDVSQAESPEEAIEQVRLITDAGVDFVEVSGGTYENPRMVGTDQEGNDKPEASPSSTTGVKESTRKREAYFLEFTKTLRDHFPDVVLMVTGGFRTREGMRDAVESGACDIVGIGRPAIVWPHLPRDIILNKEVADADASIVVETPKPPFYLKLIPIKMISSGFSSIYYSMKMLDMGKGTHVVGRQ